MLRKPLLTALSLALVALSPAAAQTATETPVKSAKRPLLGRPAPDADILGRTVFQSLVGEFALRQGNLELAVDAWTDLARRTQDPKVLARAAEVLILARQYDRALEQIDQWLVVEPASARARQMRSTVLVMANRTDDLAPQVAALLAQDPDNLPANLMQLNRLLARQTDKKAVFRLVERLVTPYRHLPEAQFALAQAALAAGDEKRSLEAATAAVAARPDWEPAVMLRAQLLLRQSANGQAIDVLGDFVAKQPGARDARLMLARLLIGEKRLGESRQHFEVLLKTAPDSPELLYPLAMLAIQQGDVATGRGLLERLLTTDFPDKSAIHYFLGQLAEETGRPEQALSEYGQVLSGDQYVTARARSAALLQKSGQVDAARRMLRETQGRTPLERTQLVLAESQLLREVARNAEAYDVIAEALKTQPDNLEFLYEAGMLAERKGDPDLMESHLRYLLSLKPDHAHALNALGYSYADRNIRLEEAERLILQALAVTPDDPYITDSLGWVYFRQGRLEDALRTLQRAYQAKSDPEIAAHIGEVLWTMGRREEARRVLIEAQRQHPDHDVLGSVIKKLIP